MTSHTFTLKEKSPVTHDTWQLVFTRPEGFEFEPGQCTHWAYDADGWRDEDRPFTMTSQPEDTERVEFVIKSYPDHDGVTKRIPDMAPGDQVIGDDPAGAITDRGPGMFIAGGAGVTPFIPILRRRARDDALSGCTLVFANKSERDIILREEWEAMEGLSAIFLVEEDGGEDLRTGRVDGDFLAETVTDKDQFFYLCGPGGMVDSVRDALKRIGVDADRLVTEKGW